MTTLICERIRKRMTVTENGLEDFTFKIADNFEELEATYKIAHDIYVQKGYMDNTLSGLRLSLYNCMPRTVTFVGKREGQVVMTMTLYPDSRLGLPMDSLYREEINKLREQGRYIAEVGSLVSLFNNRDALMHMIKILFNYADSYLNVDDLVITVNPKHKTFYECILFYEQMGVAKSYSYVKGNDAVLLRLNIRKGKEYCHELYPREPLEKDLYHFFFKNNSSLIQLPREKKPVCVWSKELLSYFLKEKTKLWQSAGGRINSVVKDSYGFVF